MEAIFSLSIMKLTWRSRRLFQHPGLYLQLWNKWYRVLKAP